MLSLWILLFISLSISLKVDFIPQPRSPPTIRENSLLIFLDTRNSIAVFGGDCSDCLYDDLWEFSLNTSFWEKIMPTSQENPTARYFMGGFSSITEEKLFVFGGATKLGYKNDLWAFDFDMKIWEKVKTTGTPSPQSFKTFTSYAEEGIQYFVVLIDINFYRLNCSDFQWEKLQNHGDIPEYSSDSFTVYYDGNIFLVISFDDEEDDYYSLFLYSYSIESLSWTLISDEGFATTCKNSEGIFIYNEKLYVICHSKFEMNNEEFDSLMINLGEDKKKWKNLNLFPEFDEYINIKLTITEDSLYVFGELTDTAETSFSNAFGKINLNNFELQLINDHFEQPPPRSHHSMVAINSKLYIFGGVDSDKIFNDIWAFDLISEKWEPVLLKGNIPSQRYYHSAGSEGDIFVIWGGIDAYGLRDDMFVFNSITGQWTELKPATFNNPSPAKGACLVVKNFKVLLYGGERNEDKSNELWEYDIGNNQFKLLSSEGLQRVSSPYCWVDDELFYVSLGCLEVGYGSNQIDFFNLSSMTWQIFHSNDDTETDQTTFTTQVILGDYLISIGGEFWFQYPVYTISAFGEGDKVISLDDEIDFISFGAGFVYFNKFLYVYGGGRGGEFFVTHNVGNPIFAKFDIEDLCIDIGCEALCSAGTYYSNNQCKHCREGTFSDKQGSFVCQECRPGTFNEKIAATSISQCIPCPEGSYNNETAAKKCISCPKDLYCPVGSISPSYYRQMLTVSSSQPSSYKEPDISKDVLIFRFSVISPIFLAVICCLIIKKLRIYLEKIDLYELGHDNDQDNYIKKQQTKIGGLFTVIFILGSLMVTCTAILTFAKANIQETKGQVPLIIMESEVSSFESKSLSFELSLDSFGGQCVKNSKCASSIEIYLVNINCSHNKTSCSLNSEKTCTIQVTCEDGEIKTGAQLEFNITERLSYTSGIQLRVTASSSIPNEDSSVTSLLSPSSGSVFIGSFPSEFNFLATPSFFKSDSKNWKSHVTGYHISEKNSPVQGSQHSTEELPFVSNFYVKLLIEINSSVLITQRLLKQDLFFFAGALLGTVSGLFGIIGFAMSFFEKQYEKLLKRLKKGTVENNLEEPDKIKEGSGMKIEDISNEYRAGDKFLHNESHFLNLSKDEGH